MPRRVFVPSLVVTVAALPALAACHGDDPAKDPHDYDNPVTNLPGPDTITLPFDAGMPDGAPSIMPPGTIDAGTPGDADATARPTRWPRLT